MRMVFPATALALLVVVLASCGGAASSPTSPTTTATATSAPHASSATAPTATPVPSPTPNTVLEFDSRGGAGSVIPLADRVIWTAVERVDRDHIVGRILERTLADGTTRVLYETSATVQRLTASATWLVWVEYADLWTASDAKVYAMPRTGGARRLIAYPLAAPDFWGRFFDMTLIDDQVYWNVNREIAGIWRGELYRRTLPDGRVELVTAVAGSHIGWPAAWNGAVVYTRTEQGDYPVRSNTPGPSHLLRRTADGTAVKIGDGGFAAGGPGFMAYLDGANNPTALFVDGHVVTLGSSYSPGYAPVVSGDWVLWADAFLFHIMRPSDGCALNLNMSIGGGGSSGSTYVPVGIGPTFAALQHVTNDTGTRTLALIDLRRIRCGQ